MTDIQGAPRPQNAYSFIRRIRRYFLGNIQPTTISGRLVFDGMQADNVATIGTRIYPFDTLYAKELFVGGQSYAVLVSNTNEATVRAQTPIWATSTTYNLQLTAPRVSALLITEISSVGNTHRDVSLHLANATGATSFPQNRTNNSTIRFQLTSTSGTYHPSGAFPIAVLYDYFDY